MSKIPESLQKKTLDAQNESSIIRKAGAIRSKNYIKDAIKSKQLNDILKSGDEATNYAQLVEQAKLDLSERSKSIPFIDDKFNKFIQLAPGSLAIIAAKTGTGKSTISANIAARLINDQKRVLVIANEEKDTDVAVRVACLLGGYNIHKYKSNDPTFCYSPKEKLDIINSIQSLSGFLEIRGLTYKGIADLVTSLEGMKTILEDAKGKYSAVIIDYYQNVDHSLENHLKDQYECQHEFGSMLDKMKHEIGCPIILFAQCISGKDHLKVRIEGRKSIFNKATDVYEFVQDSAKGSKMSILECLKDRWLGVQGNVLSLEYLEGRLQAKTIFEVIEDDLNSLTKAVDQSGVDTSDL
jgi:replicative DNA helicase